MKKVSLTPVTRVEGHLAIHTETAPATGRGGKAVHRVTRAWCEGEMFRGFENILEGRDPLDAQQIVQRICGACPISHAMASIRAQEMAYGIRPNRNGRLMQNLVAAANFIQSHLMHIYHMSVLDFLDVAAVVKYSGQDATLCRLKAWVQSALARAGNGPEVFPAAPLLPRFEADYAADADMNCSLLLHYAQALDMRRLAHEMGAVFGAKSPHSTSLVPGGCTQVPTPERIDAYRARLKPLLAFLDDVLPADVLAAARAFPQYWETGAGYANLLCFGGFECDDAGGKLFSPGVVLGGQWQALQPEAIAEEVASSRFSSPTRLHPSAGRTQAAPQKPGAYSWLKAPRYQGLPMEVGPAARIVVNYRSPHAWAPREEVDRVLKLAGFGPEKLVSVMGRLVCRALETRLVARQAQVWLDQLQPNGSPAQDFKPVVQGTGVGLVEAPRGALGHWLTIEGKKIKNYQCVVPTTWNCSPRDDAEQPGPVEKALEGIELANPEQPIEIGRVVRSFDPCLACAVH